MKQRLDRLYSKLQNNDITAFIINNLSNIFYISGFTGTAGIIILTPEDCFFLTDSRYLEQAAEETTGFEIVEIKRENRLETISDLLSDTEVSELAFEADTVSFKKYSEYQDNFTGIELKPAENIVGELRMVKEEEEIERISQAVKIADCAFEHILDYIKPGISEKEIALELEYFMKQQGGEKNAFDFIVASGPRSALPHGRATDRKVQPNEFITMDFGTKYRGYCSDMTRTVYVGSPSAEDKKIYQTVLEAHRKVIEKIRAGMTCGEADGLARNLIEENGYGDNFSHTLGHGVGIDIHEAPRLSGSSDQKLVKNMVVTDEPGIYLTEKKGVRIEDDLVITESGCKVLNNTNKELIVL